MPMRIATTTTTTTATGTTPGGFGTRVTPYC